MNAPLQMDLMNQIRTTFLAAEGYGKISEKIIGGIEANTMIVHNFVKDSREMCALLFFVGTMFCVPTTSYRLTQFLVHVLFLSSISCTLFT
jgi:hypothetical protein